MVTIEEAAKIVGWYCGGFPINNEAKYIGLDISRGKWRAYVTDRNCFECLKEGPYPSCEPKVKQVIPLCPELFTVLKLNFNEIKGKLDEDRANLVAAFLKEWNKKVDNNKGNKRHN